MIKIEDYQKLIEFDNSRCHRVLCDGMYIKFCLVPRSLWSKFLEQSVDQGDLASQERFQHLLDKFTGEEYLISCGGHWEPRTFSECLNCTWTVVHEVEIDWQNTDLK